MKNQKKKSKYYVQILAGLIALPILVLLVAYGIMFWRKDANYPPPAVDLFTTSHLALQSISDFNLENKLSEPGPFHVLRFAPMKGAEPVYGFKNLRAALDEHGYTVSDISIHFPVSTSIETGEDESIEEKTKWSLFTEGMTFMKVKNQTVIHLPFVQWSIEGMSACTNHVEPIFPKNLDSAIGVAFLMDVAGRYVQIQMDELAVVQRSNASETQVYPVTCRLAIVGTEPVSE